MALNRSQLNSSQQDFIHTVLDPMLEFDEQTTDVSKIEEELFHALTADKFYKEDNPNLYELRQVLYYPTKHLLQLESQGANNKSLTVRAVQTYLLDYVSAALKKNKCPLTHWNVDAVKAALPVIDESDLFISQLATVDNPDLWHIAPQEGDIYSCFIKIENKAVPMRNNENINIDKEFVYLDIRVDLDGTIVKKKMELVQFPDTFRNDIAVNQFIKETKRSAKLNAREFASKTVVDYFIKNNIIPPHIASNDCPIALQLLLTNKHFFSALSNYKIGFRVIMKLEEEDALLLIQPEIIALLKNDILTLPQITKLSTAELRVFKHPVYFELLKKNIIDEHDLFKVTKFRSKFLVHPHVTNLISRQKISYNQARYLALACKPLFNDVNYYEYFCNTPMNWRQLKKMNETQCLFLLSPSCKSLIINNTITIGTILSLEADVLNLLIQFPYLLTKLIRNFINLNEFEKANTETIMALYQKMYGERVKLIFQKDYMVIEGVEDNLERVLKDLPSATKELKEILYYIAFPNSEMDEPEEEDEDEYQEEDIDEIAYQDHLALITINEHSELENFQKLIIEYFLEQLTISLYVKICDLREGERMDFYNSLLAIVQANESSSAHEILHNAIGFAKEYLSKASFTIKSSSIYDSSDVLFSPATAPESNKKRRRSTDLETENEMPANRKRKLYNIDSEIMEFCTNLMTLHSLTEKVNTNELKPVEEKDNHHSLRMRY